MSEDKRKLLEAFTDPLKRNKRKRKKADQKEAKRRKVMSSGKVYAKDMFNEPPSDELMSKWKETWKQVDMKKIQSLYETFLPMDVGYPYTGKLKGMDGLIDFICCIDHCRQWRLNKLCEFGWSEDMTTYDFLSVSHSTPELLEAAVEWLNILKKMTQIMTQSMT